MRFIEHKQLLNIIITQNIDCLENKTNLDRKSIVFAHGNFLEASCMNKECKKNVEINLLNERIKELKVLYCEKCEFPVKHNIVFYGESMPKDFWGSLDV